MEVGGSILPLGESQTRLDPASAIRLQFSGAITSYTTQLPIHTHRTHNFPQSGRLFLPASCSLPSSLQ